MATAKENLYRTADDRVVPEGHPDAAFLLAAEGDEIPEGYKAPAKQDAGPAEDKAAPAPENKTRRKST